MQSQLIPWCSSRSISRLRISSCTFSIFSLISEILRKENTINFNGIFKSLNHMDDIRKLNVSKQFSVFLLFKDKSHFSPHVLSKTSV